MQQPNFDDEAVDFFLNLAIERHKIYIKKESGAPKPWTEDKVYQKFFFCNVFRQYDKCSKWIIENIVPYKRWDLLVLYRFISTYDLFLEIQANVPLDDLQSIRRFLQIKKQRGEKLFSSCFIRNPRIPGGWTETYNVPFVLIKEIEKDGMLMDIMEHPCSFHTMVNYLSRFPGTKGFMGYEYACDFEYTDMFNPTDKYTWANKGPGAQKGLSLLIHRNPYQKFNESEWEHCIRKLLPMMQSAIPHENVAMREVEHWLCEFQKYAKYKNMLKTRQRAKFRKYKGIAE